MTVSDLKAPPAMFWDYRASKRSDKLLAILFSISFIHALFVLMIAITNPILEDHSFRQAQTALSVYWLLHGGPILRYETPVVGYPWSVPFEFPLYQWLVAILAAIGISIEVAARLVSFTFYLGIIGLIRILFLLLNLSTRTFVITGTLFLCSPLYLYWSRTVMIEPCALFLSTLWFVLLILAIRSRKSIVLATTGAILAGSAAALTKATTLGAFLAIGGSVILVEAYGAWRRDELWMRLPLLAGWVSACILPLLVGFAWLGYTDVVKAMNPIGQSMTSGALFSWNFGTLQQRFSVNLWGWVIPRRMVPETLGYGFIFGVVSIIYALVSRRHVRLILACLSAFILPILVFPGLHSTHSYYQYENSVFLIAAVGLGIAAVWDSGRRILGALTLLLLVTGQYTYFYRDYSRYLFADYSDDRILRLAALAREKTKPDESLLVLGLAWGSELPYLSQRKALELPVWIDKGLMQRIFADPQAFLDDYRLGAIAYCSDGLWGLRRYGDNVLVDKFLAGREVLAEVSDCRLVSPSRAADPR